MGFLQDSTLIPAATKVDADPVPVGEGNTHLAAAEVNAILNAEQDLRTGVLDAQAAIPGAATAAVLGTVEITGTPTDAAHPVVPVVQADGKLPAAVLPSTTGLTEAAHEALNTLAHRLDKSAYAEATYTSGKLTALITYTNNTKTTTVRETLIAYDGSGYVSTVTEKQYAAGVLTQTMTRTFTLDGTTHAVLHVDEVLS